MRLRALAGLALGTLALGAAACGGDDEEQGQATAGGGEQAANGCEGGKIVGYSQPLPDPNFKIIAQVIQRDLERQGCTVRLTNANLDPGKQIADVNTLLQQGVDALIINPVDPRAVQPAIRRVNAKKIPIIAQETQTGGPYTTNVTATVEAAARDGAEVLKQEVGEGAVGAIEGPTIAEVIVRENQAFKQAAEQQGLDVVDTKTNVKITPDAARDIATAWRQRYGGDLKGVWTFNDTSAIGVASALGGSFRPTIVSINGQPDAIPLVRRGTIAATYWLDQTKIGHALAYAAERALAGERLPKQINLGMKKLTRENVDEWVAPDQAMTQPFEVKLTEVGGRTYVEDPDADIR